ncbi:MAG: hypothetical protein GWM88_06360 [Pseudomonadales bacterium]|nr:hypothetical protein [Pseudomonadales bacterium]NIX07646.1 hypothetical protein [Pseudomonadales bacterium]
MIFYLQSMLPVKPASGPFALIADPVPLWLAIPGFFLFTAAVLVLAGLKIRHMEISYASD